MIRSSRAVALLLAVGVVGCGRSAATRPGPPTTPARPTTATHEEASRAAALGMRLRSAAFDVQESPVRDTTKPVPVGELEIALGAAHVTVYVFASVVEARTVRKQFRPVEREAPDQVEVRRVGTTLYVGTIQEPAKLPMTEFNRVVRLGGEA